MCYSFAIKGFILSMVIWEIYIAHFYGNSDQVSINWENIFSQKNLWTLGRTILFDRECLSEFILLKLNEKKSSIMM
jgi:hypothetical protein